MSVDTSQLRHLAFDLSAAPAHVKAKAPAAVRATVFGIERDAKILAPVDTGNLAGSISSEIHGDGMGGDVGPTADYGAHVEYGTGPHVIRAKGGALRFTVGGRVVFATQVNHPGTSPQPYMGPAFDRNVDRLKRELGDVGEDIL